MKIYSFIIATIAFAATIASCKGDLDLTQPTAAEVTFSDVKLTLATSGVRTISLDDTSDRTYQLIVEKSHDISSAEVTFEYSYQSWNEEMLEEDIYDPLPSKYFELSPSKSVEIDEECVREIVDLKFRNLNQLDANGQYYISFRLTSSDLEVTNPDDELSFYIYLDLNEGTIENPYKISSVESFMAISNKLVSGVDTYFELTETIDFSGVDNYTPIETTSSTPINLNGNDFAIKNLTISDGQGLFSTLYGAVSNLSITDASVTEVDKFTGILAGYASATIESVHTSGSVMMTSLTGSTNLTGYDAYHATGGIVGKLENGTIKRSSSSASVGSYWAAGGVVGDARTSTITECFSTGNVGKNNGGYDDVLEMANMEQVSGGIVGNTVSSSISHCYSTATVRADGAIHSTLVTSNWWVEGRAGGIVGRAGTNNSIQYCYSYADEIHYYRHGGGVVGWINATGNTMYDCIAWVKTLTATNKAGVTASGRISGHYNNITTNLTADRCYALSTMAIYINEVVRNFTWVTACGSDVRAYDGVAATGTLIETAKTTVGFSDLIWDFTSDQDKPRLKWEDVE